MAITFDTRPAKMNIKAYRNDTFEMTLTCTEDDGSPTDFSTATILMQLRLTVDSDVVFTFESGDGITITGVDDNVISISKVVSGIDIASYTYDIEATWSPTQVKTYAEGVFTLYPDKSRS